MNIVQIAQKLGSLRFGDVDGGAALIHAVTERLPEDVYFDTSVTGEEFIEYYNKQTIEVKKLITSVSLNGQESTLIALLDDLLYIDNQRRAIQAKETKTRNNHVMISVIFLVLMSTWSVFSYHQYLSKVTGGKSSSSLMDFGNVIYDILNPFVDNTPQDTPPLTNDTIDSGIEDVESLSTEEIAE